MKKQLYPSSMIEKKKQNEKIVILTAYDYLTAQLLESSGVDYILVGDSLGNVFAGYDTTLPVTMTDMIYHGKVVSSAVEKAMVIIDMPFMSYQVSEKDAVYNAGRLIKETGAKAVIMEVLPAHVHLVKAVINAGIEVMAHIGLTPQTVYQLGGYGIQGENEEIANCLFKLAKDLQDCGCFSVLFEKIPSNLAKKISESLTIPTIGIGAGLYCDGQILVTQDVIGASPMKPFKFVKQYATVYESSKQAIQQFIQEVETSKFPGREQSF